MNDFFEGEQFMKLHYRTLLGLTLITSICLSLFDTNQAHASSEINPVQIKIQDFDDGLENSENMNNANQNEKYEFCKDKPRAIVVGASVSLGFFGPSPAIMYLKRAGFSRSCILKKTYPITDSGKKLEWLQKSVKEFKPDVIVGLDLLFHDISFLHRENLMEDRMRSIERTVTYLKSTGIPVVLGTIFGLSKQSFPFRYKLVNWTNQLLCQTYLENPNQFYILPTARIYQEIYSNKFKIQKDGQEVELSKFEVLVDQYHVGPRGAYLMTNRLISILNQYHETNNFPFVGKPYSNKTIFSKKVTAPIQAINTYGKEVNLIYKKVGHNTLLDNDETTIPDYIGDESCPRFNGY